MEVKTRAQTGSGKECIASRSLQTQASLGFSDMELAFAVSSPYSAGLDTVGVGSPRENLFPLIFVAVDVGLTGDRSL